MAHRDASYPPMARDAVSDLPFLGRGSARADAGLRPKRRARGAREALIELYGEHYAPLVRLAHLVAHDPSIAEDLVHEAFIKLYGSWHRVRDHDRAPAYLRTTLVNLARGRARRHHVALRRRPAPPPDAASAEEGALGLENRREVIDCLRRLPARQREEDGPLDGAAPTDDQEPTGRDEQDLRPPPHEPAGALVQGHAGHADQG